jgi:hypothetical protein
VVPLPHRQRDFRDRRQIAWPLRRLKASGASTLDFDYRIGKVKSFTLGCALQSPFRGIVLHFRDGAALTTDQELHRMGTFGIRASDKRIQPFDFVNEPLIHQKVESAIDRRGHRRLMRRAEPIEELVGRRRSIGLQNQGQNRSPRLGELRAAPVTCLRGTLQLRLNGSSPLQIHRQPLPL